MIGVATICWHGSRECIASVRGPARRAVHARAGARSYAPVRTVAGSTRPGDALALARRLPATDSASPSCTPRISTPSWAVLPQDTLVTSAGGARRAALAGRRRVLGRSRAPCARASVRHVVVVGLETLPSYDALAEICAAVGGDARRLQPRSARRRADHRVERLDVGAIPASRRTSWPRAPPTPASAR